MPRKFRNFNNENLLDRVEEYSNKEELTNKILGGHTEKRFVRIDDTNNSLKKRRKYIPHIQKSAKNSLFFGDLFRDLRLGNSKWKTYLNEVLLGKKRKDTILPDKVSCLIKSFEDNDGQDPYIAEHLGCRIANACGIDTVFNIAHAQPFDEEELEYMLNEYDTYDYVISVDYVPWGYTSERFSEIDLGFTSDTPLETILSEIDLKFPSYIQERNNLKSDSNMFAQFKKDFVKQFLFKQFICNDDDTYARNFSILRSEDGDYRMAPCFDMEYFFRGGMSNQYYQSSASHTICYLLKNMPEVLEEFLSGVNKAYKSGEINSIIYTSLKVRTSYLRNIDEQIGRNIIRFNEYYRTLKSEYEKSKEINFVN